MKLFLVLAAAAVALFFGTSHADPRGWMPCHLRLKPVRCAPSNASNAPAVKEVNGVIAAAYRDHLDVTLAQLYATVNRAHEAHKGTKKWAFLVEEGVPGLAQRVGELSNTARARVAAVEVETPAGRRFRAIAVRGLGLQSMLFGSFAHDLAAKEPTLKAFNRWGARFNALHRWYAVQVQSVLAVTASKDRAAVEAALLRY